MGFHIFRRDAVYYWRRRPPHAIATLLDRSHVFLSLKTTSRQVARRLAAQLDLILEDAAMLVDHSDKSLSRSQIDAMLRGVVDKHLLKLDRVARAAKAAPGFDVRQARRDDRRAFWAYVLLDAQGPDADVLPEDREAMRADGLSDDDVEAVEDHLHLLRQNWLIPAKPHILARMIDEVAAQPTAMNFSTAQDTYFRGIKLALAESDRRYGGRRTEDQGLVDRLVCAPKKQLRQAPEAVASRADLPAAASPRASLVPVNEIVQFAERVGRQNVADGRWGEKTEHQVESIARLFVKFMEQDQQLKDLNSLTQEHVGHFVDFLRFETYKHYGKAKKNEELTIDQICELASSASPDLKGLDGTTTLKRHLTGLGHIFDYAVGRGVACLEKIDLNKLRPKRAGGTKRACNQRAKLPITSAGNIFKMAPFINCAGWDKLEQWGEPNRQQIFHCAVYYVPLLAYYTGARREELCGALVEDIIEPAGGRPYIHICANSQRRIKNAQSQRNIPLHPEIIG